MRKMTRLQAIQLKGENCKHRWEAKGDSSKYITTMAISNYYYTTLAFVHTLPSPSTMRLNREGSGNQTSSM